MEVKQDLPVEEKNNKEKEIGDKDVMAEVVGVVEELSAYKGASRRGKDVRREGVYRGGAFISRKF